jgi:hypothetical protein
MRFFPPANQYPLIEYGSVLLICINECRDGLYAGGTTFESRMVNRLLSKVFAWFVLVTNLLLG